MTVRYFAGWDWSRDPIIGPTLAAYRALQDQAAGRGSDGISHADPATIAAARENAIADAITASVAEAMAETLPPPAYLRDRVVLLTGRTDLYLYRFDVDGEGFAYGDDRRKAALFTTEEAAAAVKALGQGWKAKQCP